MLPPSIFIKKPMKRWKLIFYILGIFLSYCCMSVWGMGMRNPVKYYLYLPVLLCCFLLAREIQIGMRQNDDETITASVVFVLTLTLILAGLTAVAFSSYELFVLKHRLW